MADYLREIGDAEAILADVSLLQMGVQGSVMAQARYAASGLTLAAAVASNMSAKVEASIANTPNVSGPFGQVHVLGAGLWHMEGSGTQLLELQGHPWTTSLYSESDRNNSRQNTFLFVLVAVMVLLLLVILWLACRGGKDDGRPSGQAALTQGSAAREGRRRPRDQALLAEAERSGARSPAESSTWDVADLPHICLLRMNLDQESTFTVIMNSLQRAEDVADISGPSGKKFLGASIRPGPGGRPRLAVSLLYAEEPLGSVLGPEGGDSQMDVYDQSGQVYGTIEQTENEQLCVLHVHGRPVMQLQMQGDGQKIAWRAVMGSHILATSTADDVDSGLCGGQHSVCQMQVKPGTNVVLLLLCMLALTLFKLSHPGRRATRTLGC